MIEKLAQIGACLLVETLPQWITRKIEPQPQDESKASCTRIINKEDGEIDWHLTALDLWRRVRAFNPWPGSYTRWQGKILRIIEAVPDSVNEPVEEGKVIAIKQDHKIAVAAGTGDGVLYLLKVQMEGKRVMTAEEFVRGQRDFIGSRLG
jgi:methionyl-tRNA formyltransferase